MFRQNLPADLAFELAILDKTAESILNKTDEAYWIRLSEMSTFDRLTKKIQADKKEP